jgi:NADH dehydrogenase
MAEIRISRAPQRKKVVIVGAGFGGLAAAQALKGAPVDVTVIDKRNFHLFQPLLYQVATASLSPADITAPIRSILRGQANARVVLDKVSGVDRARRTVQTVEGRSIAYDYLVLATGARHSYFGRDEWAPLAPGIKTIDDATRVRAKTLLAFERAELSTSKEERDALLTFIVVGAGPTGVEMAGAIAELARKSIVRDFRTITPHCARILLVEAGPRILAGFREDLRRSTPWASP